MENIFHLALEDEWMAALNTGEYPWSTREQTIREVGFLHASFSAQVQSVAQRFYSDIDAPLVLLTLDVEALAARGFEIRVEPVAPNKRSSEQFPHVYGGPLPVDVVSSVDPYDVPAS